ncbi:hypothetical protein JY651_48660 [Pyxidicoccus parkwayensis]|uniref:Uncharacterized protein n=1 Tax=Pyxidicoccus parkwayensis TaxID=2813578 RepID=A0ABX7NVG3_9BACT|nr:hypothetical protein [Pyxidicoccus parkwaysis]QSQ22887.1 hypothetical protein JY651_48660 [Pyxidicoccus parkwaysis]
MSGLVFDVSMLRGTFALHGAGVGGRAPLAAIGTLTIDAHGGFSGHMLRSVPGEPLRTQTLEGVCLMEPRGSGTVLAVGGSPSELTIVCSRVGGIEGAWRVDELALVFRLPDAVSGGLLTARATRLPDEGRFNQASLHGTYVGAGSGRGGGLPSAGLGVLSYDGAGRFSESNVANVALGTLQERTFVSGSDEGAYAVEADGRGTVAGGGVLFVITRAEVVDGVRRALEYAFIAPGEAQASSAWATGLIVRRSD